MLAQPDESLPVELLERSLILECALAITSEIAPIPQPEGEHQAVQARGAHWMHAFLGLVQAITAQATIGGSSLPCQAALKMMIMHLTKQGNQSQSSTMTNAASLSMVKERQMNS